MLNSSRNAMNPVMNLENLRARLQAIEYYKNLRGVEYDYWPHYVLGKMNRHLWRYKFNYAIKGFFVYALYSEIRHYNHLSSVSFMNVEQQLNHYLRITGHGILAAGIFLYI